MEDIYGKVAMIISVMLGIVLLILYKRNLLGGNLLSGITEVINCLPGITGNTLFDAIWKYSKAAVLTVEQLVNSGQIEKDSKSRKAKALEIVYDAAVADGIDLEPGIMRLSDYCIEANVHELPRNQTVKETEM